MLCCICHEESRFILTCSHSVCKLCMCKYIMCKWKNCTSYNLDCPLCRVHMPLECFIVDGHPVFRYDNFCFKISTSGLLEETDAILLWQRHSDRLVRSEAVPVRPPLFVSHSSEKTALKVLL